MKLNTLIVLIFLMLVQLDAKEQKFDSFGVDVLVGFWSPQSLHMKAEGTSGYGIAPAPAIDLHYNTTKNFGFYFGFHPIGLDNSIDSGGVNYENSGTIVNLLLGITSRVDISESQMMYYGFGIDVVPMYSLTKHVTNTPDIDAEGGAFGLYSRMGVKLKMTDSISWLMGLEYTFIPADLSYTNSSGPDLDVFTNLGGIEIQTGLAFSF